MLPELERGATDEAGLCRLRTSLAAGPWCWPDPENVRAFDLAVRATGCSSPPPPRVATTIGVTVDGACGFVWMIDGSSESSATTHAELGDTSRHSWSSAALALPQSVPLLWTSVSSAHSHEPRLVRLGAFLGSPGVEPTCQVVRGPSFGLAFLLVLASRVFNFPLPGDVVATAAIGQDGSVDGVEGLLTKINAIAGLLPHARRLLVASSQEEDGRKLADGRLEVVGVRNASHALEIVFQEQLASLLLQEGTNIKRRQELAEWFFRFCLSGRSELVDWSPVSAAAAQALSWPDLSPDQRFMLGFARGVAERHERNAGTIPTPSVDWLLARPAPLRTQLVAHLVQHVADVGQPSWDEVEPLVGLVKARNVRDAQPMQLRVEGSVARLWAITGRALDAMQRQEELAIIYLESLLYGEVSFPLAEWFRLAGVLGSRDSFARAEQMRLAVDGLGGFGLSGSVYVALSRARAVCRLDLPDCGNALEDLLQIAQGRSVPQHIKWAAARCVLRAEMLSDHERARCAVRDALIFAAGQPDPRRRHAATVNLALVELDVAIASERVSDCATAIDRISEVEPGILNHLRGAAAGDLARYVALHYPY